MNAILRQTNIRHHIVTQALLGSLFLALCSLISIPIRPVPITLQTFAIFVLALIQRPSVACASVLFYLVEATVGLPVLCGHSNPLWLFGPAGGYLVGFPLAAYITSSLKNRIHPFLAISIGSVVIYFFGFIWLSTFIGPYKALIYGVLIFIPVGLLKNGSAIVAAKWVSYVDRD